MKLLDIVCPLITHERHNFLPDITQNSGCRTFFILIKNVIFLGISDCIYFRLHPEAGVQVRVRGAGHDEGLRHVHALQVPERELDRPGTGRCRLWISRSRYPHLWETRVTVLQC